MPGVFGETPPRDDERARLETARADAKQCAAALQAYIDACMINTPLAYDQVLKQFAQENKVLYSRFYTLFGQMMHHGFSKKEKKRREKIHHLPDPWASSK
uniref:Uncharacterized protein n=1 Tax=Nelumbo nucifera TaxID=4432 RepID=A0A822ZTF7_NELNU|nr:TPA_asm: hypothetical protein HUJ06_018469 [Nelumbo nucifera]